MVRGDIIGGLKLALSKGQKLQDAMQSFYNAGYKKEDIISAAKILKTEGFVPQVIQTTPTVEEKNKIISKEIHPSYVSPPKQESPPAAPLEAPKPQSILPPIQKPLLSPQTQPVVSRQVVSAYAQPQKKKIDFMTILLSVMLLILIGVLVGVFFFKGPIIEFLNKILE